MTTLMIFSVDGGHVGQLPLDPGLWSAPVNLKVLAQAVAMYRTNQRAGTASTKTRGQVSGGGKKPWRQKHTGRARAGSIRSPLWRHGGSVFGPRPRSLRYRLPQAIRRLALLESLKGKLRDHELVVLDRLAADAPKTKPFRHLARAFQVTGASVIVLDQPSEALIKSLRNLARFDLRSASNLNALDVLNAHKVLLTKAAFDLLENRLKSREAAQPHAPAD